MSKRKKPRSTFVYVSRNDINLKAYIGRGNWKRANSYPRAARLHHKGAIDLYGWENFTHTIIDCGTEQAARDLEIYLIAINGGPNGGRLYNKTWGGEGEDKSEETCEKMSLITTELWKDDEFRAKATEANRRRFDDPAYVKAHSLCRKEAWAKNYDRLVAGMNTPEAKARRAAYYADPEVKAAIAERYARPSVRANLRAGAAKRLARPGARDRMHEAAMKRTLGEYLLWAELRAAGWTWTQVGGIAEPKLSAHGALTCFDRHIRNGRLAVPREFAGWMRKGMAERNERNLRCA